MYIRVSVCPVRVEVWPCGSVEVDKVSILPNRVLLSATRPVCQIRCFTKIYVLLATALAAGRMFIQGLRPLQLVLSLSKSLDGALSHFIYRSDKSRPVSPSPSLWHDFIGTAFLAVKSYLSASLSMTAALTLQAS